MKSLTYRLKFVTLLGLFVAAFSFSAGELQAQTCQELTAVGCQADINCQVGECADCAFCDTMLFLCDISNCVICGNGIVEGDEACDDGDNNSDTIADACRSDCREAFCGDGVQDTGEACDGEEDCDTNCQVIVQQQPQVQLDIQGSGENGCALNPGLSSQGFVKDFAPFLALALVSGLAWSWRRRVTQN